MNNKLLKIFSLGLKSYNFELITEIIDYILAENVIEALPILMEYLKEEESPSMRDYIKQIITCLNQNKLIIESQKHIYREDDTTTRLANKDTLALRLKAGLNK